MKVYFISLGCPKNLTDTEVLMGKLVASGYKITTNPSQADIIIINTCAFLNSARQEALATIRELVKWKKEGRCKKLYLAGCLPKWQAQKPSRRAFTIRKVDGIIESIGLFDYHTPRIKATSPWYAYSKIAEGCNNHCTYCLVPYIRGKLRIRKVNDILKEVKYLAKKGVKEIIYVAQDTTAHPGFAKLLSKTARIPGIQWIRIMYAHPAHIDDNLIKVIAREKKIVKYLDLPIQHACDKILKKMGRRYTRQDLENLITKIKRRVPNIALRTSVIVGFPGEGETEFEELLEFIEKVKFKHLGGFTYSKEEGTPAARMRGQVSEKVKTERLKKLMRLQARISRELNKSMIGKTLEVLVERAVHGGFVGRSYMDAPEIDGSVFIKTNKSLKPGEIVKVGITSAKTYDLIGCLT